MHPTSSLPRLSRRALLAAGLLLLTSCASVMGPRTIEISRDELLDKLGQRFPATTRVMQLLDVEAQRPDLALDADRQRVALSVPLQVREWLLGQRYDGSVRLSFGLRYEPQDASIRLQEVQVDAIELPGLPALAQRGLGRVGAWLAEEQLQDYPVYHLRPEDLQRAGRLGYEVDGIGVTRTGLAIRLRPQGAAPASNP